MLSEKYIIRFSLLLGIASWLTMLFTDMVEVFARMTNTVTGFHFHLPDLFFLLFIFFTYQFCRYR